MDRVEECEAGTIAIAWMRAFPAASGKRPLRTNHARVADARADDTRGVGTEGQDLRARDAAYHQGTVWVWLIGPFIDALLKVYPDDYAGARRFLHGFEAHLSEACIGSISEIFDAEEPFTPRGCVAQAWSVAEVLRCWVKTSPQVAEKPVDPA